MNVTIHRGSQEVGGTCIEVCAHGSRIVLDVGLPLFNQDREAVDTFALRRMTKQDLLESHVLPKVPGLFEGSTLPDAILLSHAHLDHTGLLDHTNEKIPVYATSGTSKMMLAGKLFANQVELPRKRFREVTPGTPFSVGAFRSRATRWIIPSTAASPICWKPMARHSSTQGILGSMAASRGWPEPCSIRSQVVELMRC